MNYKEIQLESDHWIVVSEISKGEESFCIWDSIFAYILDLFHCFESCSVSYINRTTNELAHNLAKLQCDLGEHRFWRNSLPPTRCNADHFYN